MDLRQRKVRTHILAEHMLKASESIFRYYPQMVHDQSRADADFWIMAFLSIRCGGKGENATIGRLMPHRANQFIMQTCYVADVFDGVEDEEIAYTKLLKVEEYEARAQANRERLIEQIGLRRELFGL